MKCGTGKSINLRCKSFDVKEMKSEMVTIKKEVEEVKTDKGSASKSKGDNKLPDGLSVS